MAELGLRQAVPGTSWGWDKSGCRVLNEGQVGAWCPPQHCALCQAALLWLAGALSPGWHRRRIPSGAAAGPAASAQGPPEASGRGLPAGPCGCRPGGPGGIGRQLPGGEKPHPPCPVPSGAWPAGARRAHPCGESSWGRADPSLHPFHLPRRWAAGKSYFLHLVQAAPFLLLLRDQVSTGGCWLMLAAEPGAALSDPLPPYGAGISQMRKQGCMLTSSPLCPSFLFCKNR